MWGKGGKGGRGEEEERKGSRLWVNSKGFHVYEVLGTSFFLTLAYKDPPTNSTVSAQVEQTS